ncbi:MAG TPA: hypothetical protein EYP63_07155 [Desulfotomaculum sp.]|nr:hypothetical protein [Desulfotomaculum sp.]
MRWLTYPGRWCILIVAAVLLVGLGYFTFGFNPPLKEMDPQELLQKALASTKGVKSYSYRIETRLVTGGGTRCLSELDGVRILPDRVSVKGKLFNTRVEIIQVEGVTYIKDCFSTKWLALEGERLGETGVFITELDPLVLLEFEEEPVVVWGKKERGKRKELYSLEFRPRLKNRFLAAQFTEFEYRLWIEPKMCRIVEVEVTAKKRTSPVKLSIDLTLSDFGHPAKVEPPV